MVLAGNVRISSRPITVTVLFASARDDGIRLPVTISLSRCRSESAGWAETEQAEANSRARWYPVENRTTTDMAEAFSLTRVFVTRMNEAGTGLSE